VGDWSLQLPAHVAAQSGQGQNFRYDVGAKIPPARELLLVVIVVTSLWRLMLSKLFLMRSF
jgi:hypothetical protein